MTQEDNKENEGRSFRLLTQAIQDFSFENIGFAHLMPKDKSPEITLNVSVNNEKTPHNPDHYIISLTVKATSKMGEQNLFILDMTYSGVFEIKGFDASLFEQLVAIQAPSLMFPFLRQIICNTTISGGYPPLLLEPIDFAGLFFQQKRSAEEVAS